MEEMSTEAFKKVQKLTGKRKLEDTFLRSFEVMRPNGVPLPEREKTFHPTRKWRWDFSWPQVKLAVEIQGGSFRAGGHNTALGQARDFEKHNAATLCGWRVLYFNTQQLKDPSECASIVIEMICVIGEGG